MQRRNQMYCSNCGTKLDEGARFCGECGSPVIVQEAVEQEIVEATEALDNPIKTCRKCSFEIEDGARFCGECGTTVNEVDNIPGDSARQTMEIPATQPVNIQYIHKDDLQHNVQEDSKKEKKSKREKENYIPLIIALVVVIIGCGAVLWYTFSKTSEPVYIELPDISSIEPAENGEAVEEDGGNVENGESLDESNGTESVTSAEPSYETDTDIEEGSVDEPTDEQSLPEMVEQSPPEQFLFPSSDVYITEEFLDTLTREEIAFIRNEIYARYGYIFQTEPYKSYFEGKEWYYPNENFDESCLNAIEKANVETIINYEKRMGWR